MRVAEETAALSYANRLQVGCIIVKDNRILSIGYNGTPAGWDNVCEKKEYCLSKTMENEYFPGTENEYPFLDESGRRYRLKTKSEVLHAEQNCLYKLARSNDSGNDAVMFITHAPCIECAKGIYASGIIKVYYKEQYRTDDGIKFLEKCGIDIIKI